MVRILVRPDGTGIWNAGSTGDPKALSVTDYAVTIVGDGPGRAVIRATTVSCFTTDSLTLKFTVRADSIRIKQVLSNDCLVSPGLCATSRAPRCGSGRYRSSCRRPACR